MAIQTINNGEAGSSVRGKINGNFGEVVTRPKVARQIADAFVGLPQDDQALLILGDSTGNEATEWPYLYSAALADSLPDEVRVEYRLYDDAAGRYGASVVLKSGTGEGAVTVGADSRGWAFLPASIGAIGTDLDVRVEVDPVAWTGVAEQVLLAQYGNSGSRVFRFYLNSIGAICLEWKTDGTNGPSAVTGPTLGFTAGQRRWVRATLDTDNGAGGYTLKFYTSTDGLTWTQAGADTIGGATTSLYQSTSQVYEIGSRGATGSSAGAVSACQGTFYSAHVSGVIDGGNKLPPFVRHAVEFNGMTGVRVGGPVLRIYNGSIAGSSMTYQQTAPRFERMVPKLDAPACVLLNSLHNEAVSYDPYNYANTLASFVSAIDGRIKNARYAICTQNPQFSPRSATQIYGQAGRARVARQISARNLWDVVDTFPALSAGEVDADGVHPNSSGRLIQFGIAVAALGLA